jgi:hypothetical protein
VSTRAQTAPHPGLAESSPIIPYYYKININIKITETLRPPKAGVIVMRSLALQLVLKIKFGQTLIWKTAAQN